MRNKGSDIASASPFAGMSHSAARWLVIAIFAATTAATFLACAYGLNLLSRPGGVALFWPAAGIVSGVLLAYERRYSIPLAAGLFVGATAANLVAGRTWPLALSFGVVNVFESFLVAYLAEGFGRPFRLDTLMRVFGFFLSACVAATAAAALATVAISYLVPAPPPPFETWHVWFRSDVTGLIAIAPLIISIPNFLELRVKLAKIIEGAVTLVVFTVATYLLFSVSRSSNSFWSEIPSLAALFPFLLLIAARLPLVYAAMAVAILTVIIIATTATGTGRFSGAQHPLSLEFIRPQFVILATAVFSFTLSALVAERKAAEARMRLLISELDHRVKNSLALVQSIVERSQTAAASTDDYVTSLVGRIRSLARTHTRLSGTRWRGAWLRDLVENELAPYRTCARDFISGPHVRISPATAQAVSMALHELATNAAKYGALSTADGSVQVSWTANRERNVQYPLVIHWRESGGPHVTPPQREGYGTRTIRDLIPYELSGQVKLYFNPDGLVCRISLPGECLVSPLET